MTFKQANDFIAEWKPRLCPGWEIKVQEGCEPGRAPSEIDASIFIAGNGQYRCATLYLHRVVGDSLSESKQRHVLLHELLHLALNDFEEAALRPTTLLSVDAKLLAEKDLNFELERAVQQIAEALVP